MMNSTTPGTKSNSQWGDLLLNIVLNIAIPAIVLTRFSADSALGPRVGLVVALAFPLGFGGWEFALRHAQGKREGRVNFFSVIGLVGVGLTGSIGLLGLDTRLVAVKEAAVPLVIGLAILGSERTKWPLVKTLLDKVINREQVRRRLAEAGKEKEYKRRMRQATYLIAASFGLSAVLNYLLASYLVTSPAGTEAFNQELGRLTALSYPIIALPSMIVMWGAIIYLVIGIQQMTDLELKGIFVAK